MEPAPRRVVLVDAAFAAALACVALAEFFVGMPAGERTGAGALLLVVENAALTLRRAHPVLAWAISGTAIAAYGLGPHPDPWLHYGAMVSLYSVAAHSSRTTSRSIAGATAGIILAVLIADWGNADVVDWTEAFVTSAAAWLLGENVRIQRAYASEMAARAEEAERRRDDEAQRAVAEERLRLARELHDVTAHHVSVMAVQAEAGQALLSDDPERAAQTLGRIASSAREALGDLRRLLGVLRDDGSDGDRTPATRPRCPAGACCGGPGCRRARRAARRRHSGEPAQLGRRLGLPHRAGGAHQRHAPRTGSAQPTSWCASTPTQWRSR